MTDRDSYQIFTKQHDRTIVPSQIDDIVGTRDRAEWLIYAKKYDQIASSWMGTANLETVNVLDQTLERFGREWTRKTVACLLVDHSGSLRGQKAVVVCSAIQVLADFFTRLGLPYEILGFTTKSWRGGSSRKDWRYGSKPKNPGRLCDLLHIVYRDADSDVPGAPWSIRNLLRDSLLKENVDGEALQWAAERLNARAEPIKVILVISDGAPVDDSTLLANGPNILMEHLKSVISDVTEDQSFTLGAVGIDYDVSDFYDRCISLQTTDELGKPLLQFAANLLTRQIP